MKNKIKFEAVKTVVSNSTPRHATCFQHHDAKLFANHCSYSLPTCLHGSRVTHANVIIYLLLNSSLRNVGFYWHLIGLIDNRIRTRKNPIRQRSLWVTQ